MSGKQVLARRLLHSKRLYPRSFCFFCWREMHERLANCGRNNLQASRAVLRCNRISTDAHETGLMARFHFFAHKFVGFPTLSR